MNPASSAVWMKRLLGYDDSLDAWGIHGVGGIVGALLTGVFATAAVNPLSEGATILKQAIGLIGVIAWFALRAVVQPITEAAESSARFAGGDRLGPRA